MATFWAAVGDAVLPVADVPAEELGPAVDVEAAVGDDDPELQADTTRPRAAAKHTAAPPRRDPPRQAIG
jgi:hypothetical protein